MNYLHQRTERDISLINVATRVLISAEDLTTTETPRAKGGVPVEVRALTWMGLGDRVDVSQGRMLSMKILEDQVQRTIVTQLREAF